jgi:hypothetical protein
LPNKTHQRTAAATSVAGSSRPIGAAAAAGPGRSVQGALRYPRNGVLVECGFPALNPEVGGGFLLGLVCETKHMADQRPAELRILCAALYAPESPGARVSRLWLEAIVPYLASKVPVKECSYYGPNEVHLGRGGFQELQSRLWADVSRGSVVSVELNAHHLESQGLSLSWQGSAIVDLAKGDAFVGIPQPPDDQETNVLRYLYSASKSMARWRYGILYKHSSWRAPALYAVGMGGGRPLPSWKCRPEKTGLCLL